MKPEGDDYVLTPFIESQEEHPSSKSLAWSSVIIPFLFPALGGFLFGYDIGATSSATISVKSSSLSGTDWYNLSSIQIGLLESGSLYGALLGSLLAFTVADFIGRRRELIASAGFYALGAALQALSPSFGLLFFGRAVYGLGIGMAMHGAPMYIAETCPNEIRGTLVSLKEAFIVLGMLTGYLVGYLAVDIVGGWRVMYGFSAPASLIMMIGMWYLPPSPRWILLRAFKGKGDRELSQQKAAAAIQRLRGNNVSQDIIKIQVQETVQSLLLIEEDVSLSEIFRGTSLKALVIGGGLVIFQQITGQPSVLYYAASIFQSAGFSDVSDATRVSVILGFFKLVMTLFAVWKVDKLGRRPLLIGGISGIIFSLLLLALYNAFVQGVSILAVISLLLYVGSYQVSFGPISWLMISEIFPLKTRGRALSIAVLLNFASNALVTFSFSPLQEAIGTSQTFFLFAVIGVLALLFVVVKVPETKGLTLEEIEAKLSR